MSKQHFIVLRIQRFHSICQRFILLIIIIVSKGIGLHWVYGYIKTRTHCFHRFRDIVVGTCCGGCKHSYAMHRFGLILQSRIGIFIISDMVCIMKGDF